MPVLAWLLLAGLGGLAIVRLDIAARRDAFLAEARTAHRLLGQQIAQHEAIAAMLATLLPPPSGASADDPARRVPALFPQVVAVQRRAAGQPWTDPASAAAERAARDRPAPRGAAIAQVDATRWQYVAVHPAGDGAVAVTFDLRHALDQEGWPFGPGHPARVELAAPAATVVLAPGADAGRQPAGLTPGFVFGKPVAGPEPGFELRVQAATGPAQWPWRVLAAWVAACAAAVAGAVFVHRQQRARRRDAELLRLARAGRLDEMGELAAGVAHELNQPLTAVLAGAQTAQRVLREHRPDGEAGDDLAAAHEALDLTVRQARRAADVLARLRRLVAPATPRPHETVAIEPLMRSLLALLQPQARRAGVTLSLDGPAIGVTGDPVALEQIVHNLVSNALQAIAGAGVGGRIAVRWSRLGDRCMLEVRDDGPGLSPEVRARLFEPFFSTREGGLGLGLPLAESLARSLGGTLEARDATPRGATFVLTLPAADGPTPT